MKLNPAVPMSPCPVMCDNQEKAWTLACFPELVSESKGYFGNLPSPNATFQEAERAWLMLPF